MLVKLLNAQSDHLLSEFKKKFNEQASTIAEQAESIKSLQNENFVLKGELNDIQQYTRRNGIRIDGIPAPDPGQKEPIRELETKVKSVFKNTLKVNLSASDFCRLHRVGRPKGDDTPRQVLVKFTNYNAKRRIMTARKLCKNHNGPHPIYINEDLTRQRAKLAAEARTAKRSDVIKDTWTYDGKIFVKLNNDEIKFVTTQGALEDLLKDV
jgi:transposase-like protein